jgi:hypothetical protein
MASSKDAALYGFACQKRMRGDKEISSNTSQSFTSQLSALISTPSSASTSKPKRNTTKENIFRSHNRNIAKRAKRDHEDSPAFAIQKHTTNDETLDSAVWQRSKRKMEEKARLYAAMKRGDVEDMDEKYTVDFDRKWAENHDQPSEEEDDDDDDDEPEAGDGEMVEYLDEFGRTRTGTRSQAHIASLASSQKDSSDRFTARPSAPATVIYGDTIQHAAFDPDFPITEQMAALAKKRDRSLTPPPEMHFDGSAEVRQKGTGFFQFSEDAAERGKQMEDLEQTRQETETARAELGRAKREGVERKVDDFFEELDGRMAGEVLETKDEAVGRRAEPEEAEDAESDEDDFGPQPASTAKAGAGGDPMDAMQRIEAALARERDDD